MLFGYNWLARGVCADSRARSEGVSLRESAAVK